MEWEFDGSDIIPAYQKNNYRLCFIDLPRFAPNFWRLYNPPVSFRRNLIADFSGSREDYQAAQAWADGVIAEREGKLTWEGSANSYWYKMYFLAKHDFSHSDWRLHYNGRFLNTFPYHLTPAAAQAAAERVIGERESIQKKEEPVKDKLKQAKEDAIALINKHDSVWAYSQLQLLFPKCTHPITGMTEGSHAVYHGTDWNCHDPANLGQPVEKCIAVMEDSSLHTYHSGHKAGECPWLIYEKPKEKEVKIERGAVYLDPDTPWLLTENLNGINLLNGVSVISKDELWKGGFWEGLEKAGGRFMLSGTITLTVKDGKIAGTEVEEDKKP